VYLHIYIFGLYICIHIQPNVPCFCLNEKTVSGTRILVTGLTDSRIEKYNGLFGKVIQKCKKAANRVVVLIYCPIRSKNVKISLNIKNIKISIDNSEKIEQDRIHYDDSEIDKIREFAHNLNLKKKNEIEALSFSAKLQNCFRDFGDFFAEFKTKYRSHIRPHLLQDWENMVMLLRKQKYQLWFWNENFEIH